MGLDQRVDQAFQRYCIRGRFGNVVDEAARVALNTYSQEQGLSFLDKRYRFLRATPEEIARAGKSFDSVDPRLVCILTDDQASVSQWLDRQTSRPVRFSLTMEQIRKIEQPNGLDTRNRVA